MTKTYYAIVSGHSVRYFYDRSLKVWTIYEVSQPNEDGDQIGAAEHEPHRQHVLGVAEFVVRCNHRNAHSDVAA